VDLASLTPEQEIAALRHELAATKAQLNTAAVQIEHLRAQLAALRRQQYGRSSERLDAAVVQLELQLEDLEETEAGRQASLPAPVTGNEPSKPRSRPVRKPLPDHLPRETVVHEPAIVCDCCVRDRSKLARLGEDVSEILEKIPARLKVIRHVRPRYACRKCEQVFPTCPSSAAAPALG
jgi:transposase